MDGKIFEQSISKLKDQSRYLYILIFVSSSITHTTHINIIKIFQNSSKCNFHIFLVPTNDIGFVDADVPKKVKRETVKGELSTIPGVEVTVTPSGDVKVVKTIDPDWD